MSQHHIEEKDGIVIVTVKGNLMGGPETEICHQSVKTYIEAGKVRIIADLSHVKWLNSRGLGMLIACYTSCKNGGGDFKLAGATEKVKSLLMMTKLLQVFSNHETVAEAMQEFS